MNENSYKKSTITLTTIGPVHIGSGEEISKKECWDKGNKVAIMDMDKVMDLVNDKGVIPIFENYMTKKQDNNFGNKNKIKTFNDFIDECKEKYTEKFKEVRFDDYKKYEVEYKRDKKDKKNKKEERNIMAFIKQNGQPYIPASSIKGAIRTAIIATRLNDENTYKLEEKTTQSIEIYEKIKKFIDSLHSSERGKYKDLETKIDEILKNNKDDQEKDNQKKANHNDDIMSGIIIRDGIIDKKNGDCLEIYSKLDCPKQTDGEKASKIPITRECIKPGIKVEFELIIDTDKIKLFDKNYIDKRLLYLKKVKEARNKSEENDKNNKVKSKGPTKSFAQLCLENSFVNDVFDEEISDLEQIIKINKNTNVKYTENDEKKIINIVVNEIKRCVKSFYEDYEENFRQYYCEKDNKDDIIYLGGGAGFISKTVLCQAIDTLFEKGEEDKKNKLRNMIIYKDEKDKGKYRKYMELENAPKMMKKASIDKKDEEMGRCKIEIGAK